MIKKLAYVVAVVELVIIDSVITWYAIRMVDGVTEVNPIMRQVMVSVGVEETIIIFSLVKLVAISIAYLISVRSGDIDIVNKVTTGGLVFLSVLGFLVLVNNLYWVWQGIR